MKCYLCGVNESIPFVCNYCGESFCHIHRIPMNHSCPLTNKYSERRRKMTTESNTNTNNNLTRLLASAIKIKSSKTELLHLLIATVLVTTVGLSLNNYRYVSWEFLAVFVSAFLVHELAYKFLAQFYGSWSEFCAQLYGLIITAISATPFMPFKFIAPGAVMVGLSGGNSVQLHLLDH
jgi:AN1-like Zinc finger